MKLNNNKKMTKKKIIEKKKTPKCEVEMENNIIYVQIIFNNQIKHTKIK